MKIFNFGSVIVSAALCFSLQLIHRNGLAAVLRTSKLGINDFIKTEFRPESFEALTRRLKEATVMVCLCDTSHSTGGIPCSKFEVRGSGFFVNAEGLLITAHHVVAGPLPSNKAVFIVQRNEEGKIWWALSNQIAAEYQDIDTTTIKFYLGDQKIKWLPFSPTPASQGEEIAVFGYPADDFQMLADGTVDGNKISSRVAKTIASSVEKRSLEFKPNILFMNKEMVEAQFTFVRGNSGGPIVSTKTGKVVGLVTGAANIPQDVQQVSIDGKTSIGAVPFATYSYGISVSELKTKLISSLYSLNWAPPQRSGVF